MNKNRRWFPLDEPMCDEPHPVLRYLCAFNRGHDGDHMEGINRNSWPNAEPTEEVVSDNQSETMTWPIPAVAVERKGNHVYTAGGTYVMNAYAETARRDVKRLTQELAEAVAASALLDGEEAGDPTPAQVLDLNVEGDFGEGTVREWLIDLLAMVWTEREGFNGKRPWGNSSWEWEVYRAMINAGFLTAHRDQYDEERLSEDERRKADRLIADAIRSLGTEPTEEGTPA